LSDHSALIKQLNFFPRATKNRLADPSEICAFDFARQFPRFRICSISATIGIDSVDFQNLRRAALSAWPKKDRLP
jgi:hypothetical protein